MVLLLQNFMVRRGDGGVELIRKAGRENHVQVFTPGEVLPELKVVQSMGWELQVHYITRWDASLGSHTTGWLWLCSNRPLLKAPLLACGGGGDRRRR